MPYTTVQKGLGLFLPRNTLRAYWKSQYLDELTDEAITWVRSAWESLAPHGTGSGYLNLTGRAAGSMHAGVDGALHPNQSRLTRIKKIYDPDNFFQ